MEKLNEILSAYKINADEYVKLNSIGGHIKYHLEGSALKHSLLVWNVSLDEFPDNWVMQRAALLHDIGKIYTSIKINENSWEYPDHSICGSFKGILCKFIDVHDEHFVDYQWLIRNHIKPLFWGDKKGTPVDTNSFDKDRIDTNICNLHNLATLAICDLKGSIAANPENSIKLINYLRTI